MRVYLCGSDGLMTEHGLYGAQVGSALKQRGGEGMAKRVWRHRLLYASLFHQVLDHEEYHDTSERLLAALADEDIVLVFWSQRYQIAVEEIQLYLMYGLFRYGHQALFGALAIHLDELVAEIHVAYPQIDQLAHSQPATEQGLSPPHSAHLAGAWASWDIQAVRSG